MFALLLFAAAYAPPPPGSPSITIADLATGNCSISVVIVGDDALSSRFNAAVVETARHREGAFCRRAKGNYVIYTNSNVMPTDHATDHFRYHVTVHDARDFIAYHDSGSWKTLVSEEKECREAVSTCAKKAVSRVLTELEAQ